ncbi:DUF2125 domain-containing protein [Salipiger sp.]|uniref:DUF2125 domain-containing protein n=1 Tax=Salipiger sp. TaxID=2078585 RepID=UPI003A979AAF
MRVSVTALGASLAALLAASPALADVTPAQVWDNLSGYMAELGYTVGGTVGGSDAKMTVSGATISLPVEEPDGTAVIRLGDLSLSDLGDGTVRVSFPESMPIEVMVTPPDEQPVEVVIDYRQQGLDMIVSGTPEEMVYAATADSITLALSKLVADGAEMPRDVIRAEMSLAPVTSDSTIGMRGDMRHIAQSTTIGTLSYDIAGRAPDGSGSGNVTGRMSGVSGASDMVLPTGMAETDPAAIMASSLEGTSSFRHEGGDVQFSFTEEGKTTSGAASSGGLDLSARFSGAEMALDTRATGVTWNAAGGDLPFPLSASTDELAFATVLPLAKSDTPEDVALGVTLAGFTTADMIWNLFDPGKVLPRDPATIAIDLTGKVTPFVNLFDEAEMARVEAGEVVPGELNALTLNSLTVEAAGAKITGTGDFVFDNTDMTSFEGMPKPTGEVNLTVAGANGLIDNLIRMGFVSEEDAMGARMMLSMFGVPGPAPDSLTSKIEVNDQGHVLANGQRIK